MPQFNSTSGNSGKIRISVLVWLVFCAVVVSTCGAFYAIYKHEQVTVKRDISKMQQQIVACRLNIEQYEARMAEQTNLWVMRDRLSQSNSSLRDITPDQIETALTPVTAPSYAHVQH